MKICNDIIRRFLLAGSVSAAAAVLTFAGCTKADDTVGASLVPDNQQMKAGYVVFDGSLRSGELNPRKYVETRLYQTDSIVASNISYGYMGSMLNDTLGRRSAGFLSQYINYYLVDSGYFGYRPILDSVQILLSLSTSDRDTLTDQTFGVYEVVSNTYLTEKPIGAGKTERDTLFYLNFDPEQAGILGDRLFTFTLGQSNGTGPSTTAVTMVPTEAGRSFIARLMLQEGDYAGDYSIYSTDSLAQWVEEFKGLYIRPEVPVSEYGKGAIYATDLSASGFSVYGRNRVEADPSLIQDTIGMVYYFYDSTVEYGNVSVNTVERDYAQAVAPLGLDLADAVESNGQRPENPLVYVEGMGGIVTEMTFTQQFFDDLEALIEQENAASGKDFTSLAFSQVRMFVYFRDSDYDWTAIDPSAPGQLIEEMDASPERLGLYTDYKLLTPVADYAYVYEQTYSTTLDYDGYVNRSRGCYIMSVTAFVQALWNNYAAECAAAESEGRAVDLENVAGRRVYIAPSAYDLFTGSFAVLQGMVTEGSGLTPENNAPIRFEIAYNLIK